MKTDIIICHLKDQTSELHPISRDELGREVDLLAKEAKFTLTQKEMISIIDYFIAKEGKIKPKTPKASNSSLTAT